MNSWKTIETKTTFKNGIFSIQEDKCLKEDGSIVEKYYTITRPNIAVVGAFTKEGKLIMVKQYRHPVKTTEIELPAGYLEDDDHKLAETATRELLEETGYKIARIEKLKESYASAGIMNNKVVFFIGFDAEKIKEPELDENEELELHLVSWEQAWEHMQKNEVKDLGSVAGMYLLKEYLDKHGKP